MVEEVVDAEAAAADVMAAEGKLQHSLQHNKLRTSTSHSKEKSINIMRLHFFSGRGGGLKGGAKVIIEAHRHEGVFIARSKEDALVTLNSTPGQFLS
jgi:hypothetical protein